MDAAVEYGGMVRCGIAPERESNQQQIPEMIKVHHQGFQGFHLQLHISFHMGSGDFASSGAEKSMTTTPPAPSAAKIVAPVFTSKAKADALSQRFWTSDNSATGDMARPDMVDMVDMVDIWRSRTRLKPYRDFAKRLHVMASGKR